MKRVPAYIAFLLLLALVGLVDAGAPGAPVSAAATPQTTVFLPRLTRRWVAPDACPLGVHLGSETTPLLTQYASLPGTASAFSYAQAESAFPQLPSWQRLIVQPSLVGLESRAQRAAENNLAYEGLVYAPDQRPATPEAEWQDLVGATQSARSLADRYGKRLILAPGILLMAENPELYPAMAALADGWIIDTAPFQNANPPGEAYRWDVTTVVNRLHQGSTTLDIWAQIVLDPDAPDPDAWLAYWDSLRGLLPAGDVLANFGAAGDPAALRAAIEELIVRTCHPGP